MVKRDWKLPKLLYFTYTSIVQPILQVKISFYKVFWEIVLFQIQQNQSGKKGYKMIQNGSIISTGYIETPQWVNGVDRVLFYMYTPFYKQTTHLYKPTAHFHSFWTKSSKFEAGKMVQNGSIIPTGYLKAPKGLPTDGDITYLQLDPNFAKIGPAGPELA